MEYGGLSFAPNCSNPRVWNSDKRGNRVTVNGAVYPVIATAPSAYVNDAVWVHQAPYTPQDLARLYSVDNAGLGVSLNDGMLETPGFRTNMERRGLHGTADKCFLVAREDIPAGAELFSQYGKYVGVCVYLQSGKYGGYVYLLGCVCVLVMLL